MTNEEPILSNVDQTTNPGTSEILAPIQISKTDVTINVIDDTPTTEEEKELVKELQYFDKYPKLKHWAILFTDKNNKATYGNRTESAMQAYNCNNRITAAAIGSQNFKKLHGLASIFAEDKGITFDKFMETAMARALTSENPRWWEMIATVLGYHDAKNAPQVVVNNNTQNNTNYNLNAPEVVDFNQKFKKFIENQ